jgi:hypothetical protein
VVGAANKQGYHYNYDALNRLITSGHYKERFVNGTGGVWQNDDSNLETDFNYDLNGNIITMKRKGANASQMKKLLMIFMVLYVSLFSLYSQDRTIKGRVITEDLEAMPYTLIVINDTVEVGKSDLNGFFQIVIPVSVKKILFLDIGLETASIELADTCDEVEVVMMVSSTYDFMSPKKVDRLRMKRFKNLPELHKEAFEKGIFKTDRPCYTREFMPHHMKR